MKLTDEQAEAVLRCPMKRNDADASTIGEYLILLAAGVWRETECFSGKRPFGNSTWWWDLYYTLAEAGLLEGTITYDEDGYIEADNVDGAAGHAMITQAIEYLARKYRADA